jgi:hypothetical protein
VIYKRALCEPRGQLKLGDFVISPVWKVVYALDCVLPNEIFDPIDEGKMCALADGMYVRSGRLVPGCVGAIDGILHIN